MSYFNKCGKSDIDFTPSLGNDVYERNVKGYDETSVNVIACRYLDVRFVSIFLNNKIYGENNVILEILL